MIVKCIANKGKDLPEDSLLPNAGYGINSDYNLIIDKYYPIYAMTIISGYMWYYICDESDMNYPLCFPSTLLKSKKAVCRSTGCIHLKKAKIKKNQLLFFAFPEWINERYFYYNLLEDEDREIAIFKAYKKKMNLEFPNPWIKETVTILDSEWLMCPICIDAWQSVSDDGMIICPYCKQMKHNPRYVSKAPKNLTS